MMGVRVGRWAGVGLLVALGLWGCGGTGGGGAVVDSVARLVVTPAELTVAAGSETALSVEGRTAADRPVAVAPTWSVDTAVGTIEPDGRFTATTTTSSATPAQGAITVQAGALTATVPVTVVPAEATRIEIVPPEGIDLSAITPGTVLAFRAEGEDRYGNRGVQRFAITPNWSVTGDLGVIDAGGQFVATHDGSGQIVAEFGDQTATIDLTVYLPAGVRESQGALLQPGQPAEIPTAAGFVLHATDAVEVPTTVVVQVVDTPDSGLPEMDVLTYAAQSASVTVPTGELTRAVSMTVPSEAPGAGRASYPVVFLNYGEASYPVVNPLTEDGALATPLIPVTPASRQSQLPTSSMPPPRPSARYFHVETPIPVYQYQLGPLDRWQADKRDTGLSEGYGVNTPRRGSKWMDNSRVAIVVHGMKSDPGVFRKSTFGDFLTENPVRGNNLAGGLGYNEVWTFHYDWTRHIAENGQIFADLLKQAMADAPSAEVDVFCHSMGGLVTRHMLEMVRHPGVRINRVVTLGTPHGGSPMAGHTRAAGRQADLGDWPEGAIDPVNFMGESLASLVVAADQWQQRIAESRDALYDTAALTSALGYRGVADLAEGSQFLVDLNNYSVPEGRVRPVYYAIAGVRGQFANSFMGVLVELGQTGMGILGGITVQEAAELNRNGDGVVAKSSALLNTLDQEAGAYDGLLSNQPAVRATIEDMEHTMLTSAPEVRNVLRRWWNATNIDAGSITIFRGVQ